MIEFVNNIKQKLESAGFSCENEDTVWKKEFIQNLQGATISINGQVMQQPGSQRKIGMKFTILYEFTVTDIDTGKEDKSLMCNFKIYDGNHDVQNIDINFYADEFVLFLNLCNKIFKI